MTAAVNIIQATILEADDTDGKDTALDDSDTATDDDNELDFQKEGKNFSNFLNSNMETLPIHLLTSKAVSKNVS